MLHVPSLSREILHHGNPFQGLTLLFGAARHPAAMIIRLVLGLGSHIALPRPLPTPGDFQVDSELIERRWDGLTALRQIRHPRSIHSPNERVS